MMKESFERPWSAMDYARFVLPSILGAVSVSLYTIIDALFIARYVGAMGMAAVSIVMPFFSLAFGVGIMVGSGSSAIIGIELGRQKKQRALRHFSLIGVVLVLWGLASLIALFGLGPHRIASALGATEKLLPYCEAYMVAFAPGIAMVSLQIVTEFFMRLDGRPMWAFYLTLIAGLTNVVLDYLLIAHWGMGLTGAGIASSAGIAVAVAIGLYYFTCRSKNLRFVRPMADWRFLRATFTNGSSEMVSEIAAGVKTLVFNYVLIRYAGEYGVASMSILMYLYFLLASAHFGVVMGVSPVVSYNYGSRNFIKLRQVLRQSAVVVGGISVLVFVGCYVFGDAIIGAFANGNQEVFTCARNGLLIVSFGYLLEGLNIFASGFFTSVNNGKISALIAFFKTFVFTLGLAAVLPMMFAVDGVWLSVSLAELAAVLMSAYFYLRYRRRYVAPTEATVAAR